MPNQTLADIARHYVVAVETAAAARQTTDVDWMVKSQARFFAARQALEEATARALGLRDTEG